MVSSSRNPEQGSVQMAVTWEIVGVIVAVALAAAGYLLFRRRPGDNPLSRLVADALASEWAGRTGCGVESVRSAILRGEPADVHDRLAALVADVEIAFDHSGPGSARATVECKYADDPAVVTVTLSVPWDRLPQPVREQFLRSDEKHVRLHWSILQPA
jgi:hypothetical protein